MTLRSQSTPIVLKTASILILPLALALVGFTGCFECLGLLILCPLLASLAWVEMAGLATAVALSLGAILFFTINTITNTSNNFLGGASLMLAVGGASWISYLFIRHDSLARHMERKMLEDLEDEVVLLRQDIESCESALLTSHNRKKQYTLLNEAARLLGSSLDLQQLAEIILEQAVNILGHKQACYTLFILDKTGAEMFRKQRDLNSGVAFPEERAYKTDEINHWVLSRNSPLIIRNIAKDFRFKGLDPSRIAGRSFMISPFGLEGRMLALIRIESRQEDLFDMEDQRFLESFVGLSLLALENARLYTETQELAVTDGLTKLFLRRTLLERLEEELKRASKAADAPLSLILLDLDHFKQVNDQYGHTSGDLILREVAQAMKSCVREVDLCGRYGGEEFAVLLPATNQAGAKVVAERIRESVAGHAFNLADKTLNVTISAGVSVFPQDAQEIEGLIQKADLALYQSKQNGRNQVTAFADTKPSGAKG